MWLFKYCFKCFYGPKIFKIYGGSSNGLVKNMYIPNRLERWPELVFMTMHVLSPLLYIITPVVGFYWIIKPSAATSTIETVQEWGPYIASFFAMLYIIRGVGRACNKTYREFLKVYYTEGLPHNEYLKKIRLYDFEFKAFPICYSVEPKLSWWDSLDLFRVNPFKTTINKDLAIYKRIPIQILGFIATHTFGICLIYPGMLTLLKYAIRESLLVGRTDLVDFHNGVRSKVRTADNNDIDVMMVDNRRSEQNGEILVVTCEGNSGFYEIGIMTTVLKAGYSSIGYNRPGFGFSTGNPYPAQERRAIEAVIQFAVDEYGFEMKNIVLFGWSIGGYAAAYAATCFPGIRHLILDASFGHIMPLALNAMPKSWEYLVKEVIGSYINLDISALIRQYGGPVLVIRRLEDEIIALQPPKLMTNCGNELVLSVLLKRHPSLCTDETTHIINRMLALSDRERKNELFQSEDKTVNEVIALISKYLLDVNGQHCDLLKESVLETTIGKPSTSDE